MARRGNDVEGDILVSLQEAMHGSIRSVSMRLVNPRTSETTTHTYKVRIPAGVQDGQLIRLAGKGEEGVGGAAPGDLYLHVRLAAHPDFRVRGADLYHELDLAPWEAVLGATVSVPTLDGPVSMKIPPGTIPGQQLRLRGRGLPRGPQGERGDLYVAAHLRLPSHVTDDERALWERLAVTSKFNPRTT